MTEDEMVGWHHQLNGHEFEQTLGDRKGQGSLACCSSWVHKELYMTEQQQWDFPDNPVVGTSPFSAGGVGLIPVQ